MAKESCVLRWKGSIPGRGTGLGKEAGDRNTRLTVVGQSHGREGLIAHPIVCLSARALPHPFPLQAPCFSHPLKAPRRRVQGGLLAGLLQLLAPSSTRAPARVQARLRAHPRVLRLPRPPRRAVGGAWAAAAAGRGRGGSLERSQSPWELAGRQRRLPWRRGSQRTLPCGLAEPGYLGRGARRRRGCAPSRSGGARRLLSLPAPEPRAAAAAATGQLFWLSSCRPESPGLTGTPATGRRRPVASGLAGFKNNMPLARAVLRSPRTFLSLGAHHRGRAGGGEECRCGGGMGPPETGGGGGKRGSCFSGGAWVPGTARRAGPRHAEPGGPSLRPGFQYSLCIYLNESLCTCI